MAGRVARARQGRTEQGWAWWGEAGGTGRDGIGCGSASGAGRAERDVTVQASDVLAETVGGRGGGKSGAGEDERGGAEHDEARRNGVWRRKRQGRSGTGRGNTRDGKGGGKSGAGEGGRDRTGHK